MFAKLEALKVSLSRLLGLIVRRDRANLFYLVLLLIFSAGIVINYLFDISNEKYDPASFDLAIEYRLSSPVPDPEVIILDIDERSLAAMAEEYGRWPWPREVHAEALARLEEEGVQGIAFNIMFSDSDLNNPDSDALFDEIATELSKTTFPFIRLNPQNDKLSKLTLGSIPSVRFENDEVKKKTIAAIIPYFQGTRDKLGVANQTPDDDGLVRRYPINLSEEGFAIPSLAKNVLSFSEKSSIDPNGNEIILNWRNKKGDYQRVSFSDFFMSEDDASVSLENKLIVYGISAPGISSLKSSPAFSLMDDNAIIATAIDDLKNNTHLRVMSKETVVLLSIFSIFLIFFAFRRENNVGTITAIFGVGEIALIAITFGSVSYTNYLIDLTQVFLISSAYFVVALAYHQAHVSAYRGAGKYLMLDFDKSEVDHLIVYGFYSKEMTEKELIAFRRLLETKLDPERIIILDNAFSTSNFIGTFCNDFNFVVLFANSTDITTDRSGRNAKDILNLEGKMGYPKGDFKIMKYDITSRKKTEEEISYVITTKILEISLEFLEDGETN